MGDLRLVEKLLSPTLTFDEARKAAEAEKKLSTDPKPSGPTEPVPAGSPPAAHPSASSLE